MMKHSCNTYCGPTQLVTTDLRCSSEDALGRAQAINASLRNNVNIGPQYVLQTFLPCFILGLFFLDVPPRTTVGQCHSGMAIQRYLILLIYLNE